MAAPFITPMEPLLDVLVHGQDIVLPLGRTRPMPTAAAAAAAQRAWDLRFPFRARKRLAGLRLTATDTDWAVGSGVPVDGPIAALLLLAVPLTVMLKIVCEFMDATRPLAKLVSDE